MIEQLARELAARQYGMIGWELLSSAEQAMCRHVAVTMIARAKGL